MTLYAVKGTSGTIRRAAAAASSAGPIFSMGLSSHDVSLTAAVETTVDFDQIFVDTAGICTGGGQITIGTATEGWWRLEAGCQFLDGSVNTPLTNVNIVMIRYADLSGFLAINQFVKTNDPNTNGIYANAVAGHIVGLLAGDVIEVAARADSAGFTVNNVWQQTYFEGFFLRGY